MNAAQRERISALITEKLLALLEQEEPSAKLLETGMRWLEKIEKGDIKSPELEKEKVEQLRQRIDGAGLPFTTTPRRTKPLGQPAEEER